MPAGRRIYRPRSRLLVLVPLLVAGSKVPPAWASPPLPIKHVILIMQENRSFDSYFGTYPGAVGLPQNVCVWVDPDNRAAGCVAPFHDQHDENAGGPHGAADAQGDIDDGITTARMDGFIIRQTNGMPLDCGGSQPRHTGCELKPGVAQHDVMGYHNADEIPNYWAYANHFVLQDRMFEDERAWSMSAHLGLTSQWVATCTDNTNVATCTTASQGLPPAGGSIAYPWVNMFQLMDINDVSWKYYLGVGKEPDCDDGEMDCEPALQGNGVLSLWNPVPGFAWVVAQGASYLAFHNPPIEQFLLDLKNGTLPQVSYIVPSNDWSEHPPAGITVGMEFVTSLVNAVMQSPYWNESAIFIAWDDWGGFYDHLIPPIVDRNNGPTPVEGYGMRVPGLLISPWAKPGFIDHSLLSFDSYATFIENIFMNGMRLDPAALGEPDSRPTIRDSIRKVTTLQGETEPVGRLLDEFDFHQAPLPPLVLSTHIPPSIRVACGSTDEYYPQNCTGPAVTIHWGNVVSSMVPGPFKYQVLRDGVAVPSCHTRKLSCLDTNVSAGSHYYRVYSIDSHNVASPPSAAAEADVP